MEACLNPGVLKVIYFIKLLMHVIFIIAPIGLIIMGSVDLSKSVINSDDQNQKKNLNTFLKRLLYSVILFSIPWIVNTFMSLIGDLSSDVNFADCFINAEKDKIEELDENYEWTNGSKSTDYIPEDDSSDDVDENDSSSSTGVSGKQDVSSGSDSDNSERKIIYIGDSRTVGMIDTVYPNITASSECKIADSYGHYYMGCEISDNEIGIAKVSENYTWFSNSAISKMKKIITNSAENYSVVILMGVNDPGNVSKYISSFNTLVNSYPKVNFVFVSVNPINDDKASGNYAVTNQNVINFNTSLKNGISNKNQYCDVYSKIVNNYSTTDGVHYTADTYKKIYSEIQKCL